MRFAIIVFLDRGEEMRRLDGLAARPTAGLAVISGRRRIGKAYSSAGSTTRRARRRWGPVSRWWSGNAPEWDVVSESADGRTLLLGEARWMARPPSPAALARMLQAVAAKPAPALGDRWLGHAVVRALFVPDAERKGRRLDGTTVVTAADLGLC